MTNNLKKRREELGLKQQDIARAIGVGKWDYSRYESGKIIPPMDKAIAIAKALKTTVDDLWNS